MQETSKNVVGTRKLDSSGPHCGSHRTQAKLHPIKQNLSIICISCLPKIHLTTAHRQEAAHCCQGPSFTLHGQETEQMPQEQEGDGAEKSCSLPFVVA